MLFRKFLADRSAATAVEYGLLAVLISVGMMVGVGAFGGKMNGMFIYISEVVEGAWAPEEE